MKRIGVLIVGAGPTGLTLACDLARRGVAFRIVEKAPQLFIGSRAKGLQPRTLEVFDDLGVIDAVKGGGAPFPPFRLYSGREIVWERSLEEMLRLPPAAPRRDAPHPRTWLIPQWRTDAILHDRLVALGGHVETSTALEGLVQEDGGVVATIVRDGVAETILADWVVGADGGRSFVPKAAGFTFEGETNTEEHTLIGDVRVKGLQGEACHILTKAGDVASRFSLWNLPQSEHYQLVVTMAAGDTPELTLGSVRALLAERSGRTDIELDDLRWISLYRINVRMVDRLRIGRVLLAGDAAHVHSSAGGQGLNTGVQDAYNLGWKLAAASQSPRGEALIDTYDEERLPVAAHVLGLTSKLHRAGFQPPPSWSASSIDQLDISYRSSSLAFDDRTCASRLAAGDRAPDAVLPGGGRVFDVLLRGPHFSVLAFGERPLASLGAVRVERIREPLEPYGVSEGFVVVRPDGHVGAISSSAVAIRDSLERVGALPV